VQDNAACPLEPDRTRAARAVVETHGLSNGAFVGFSGNVFSNVFSYGGWRTAPSRASRFLIKHSAALSYLRECEAGGRVPFDLYGATPSGPGSRGSALGASGPAKRRVFVALLSGDGG
jgi:hypothetical protein